MDLLCGAYPDVERTGIQFPHLFILAPTFYLAV